MLGKLPSEFPISKYSIRNLGEAFCKIYNWCHIAQQTFPSIYNFPIFGMKM